MTGLPISLARTLTGAHSRSQGMSRPAAHAMPGYRADIDGLRALAILPVLLFHLGVPGLPGGFVGVDIFFVISGFVITRGLWADLDTGCFSLGGFYERRVRRLLPALGVTLAVTTLAAWLILLPPALIHYLQSLAASSVSAANLFLWVGSSYFAPDSRQVPLMHLWSLAVEEQFYLLFPVLLAAGHRRFRRACGPTVLAVALISFALNLLLLPVAPSATFFLLPTRLWELLAGALLALYPVRTGPVWSRHAAATVGIALIALPILAYDELTPFPGIAALPPVLGAAALILAGFPQGDGHPATPITRLLAAPLSVFVGRLSYPLYLVHWPIIVLVREVTMREPDGGMIAAMIVGSIALACAIQRWVEQPLRYAKADRRTVLRLAATILLMAALAGILGVTTRGAPGRLALPATKPLLTDARWGKGRCFFEGGANPLVWREAACTRVRAAGPKVLLWGDSFAAHYAPGLEANAGNVAATIVQYTAAACIPLLDTSGMTSTCRAFNAHVLDIVRQGRFTHVIIAARWQNWRARGFDALPATIATLREAGASVTVIGQTPLFAADVQTIAYRVGATGPDANGRTASWPIAVDRGINQTLRRAASGAHFVDPIATLCGEESCPYKAGPSFLFADDGHFSAMGSRRAVQLLFPFIRDRADHDFEGPLQGNNPAAPRQLPSGSNR